MSQPNVPYFKSHQDPQLDAPAYFVDEDKARSLKRAGTHYFAMHSLPQCRGVRAIVEIPPQALPEAIQAEREESQFSGWRVVGQTVRGSIKQGRLPSGPGLPGWELCR